MPNQEFFLRVWGPTLKYGSFNFYPIRACKDIFLFLPNYLWADPLLCMTHSCHLKIIYNDYDNDYIASKDTAIVNSKMS